MAVFEEVAVVEEGLALDRVYQKTEAGVEEIRQRNRLRDMQRRSLLLLINGVRPAREVCETLRLADVDARRFIGELLDLGLIEPAAPAKPPQSLEVQAAAEVALPEVERIFAQYIGPLAPVLLRKHVVEARDRADLIARLAGHLNDQQQRLEFVAAVARLRAEIMVWSEENQGGV
jgi:hypothetical protein